MEAKRKMRPVLDGDFWMIGDSPDLGELNGTIYRQECVDHHIFKAADGMWHLWGCIRATAVGRILYHWRARNLTDQHWEQTGEMIRCRPDCGENLSHWYGEEWIQSPYVIQQDGKYYMFYGGHSTEWDYYGRVSAHEPYPDPCFRSAASRGQICVMTSDDGLTWERHVDETGRTRLFTGPGEARDPMLLKIGDVWHLYYAGGVIGPNGDCLAQNYVRTSRDLLHWSDWQVVHFDPSVTTPENASRTIWTHECPFVIKHAGYYYLFRTQNYNARLTHVYRSEDPMDFGLGAEEAQKKYVGILPVAAPEVIMDTDGTQYITSSHNPESGTMLCRLRWEDD